MDRIWIAIGAANGFLAVAAGAFGAHGLRARLPPERLAAFETGARYHLIHALALVAVGLFCAQRPVTGAGGAGAAGWAMTIGIVLFCGSLYALALSGVRGLGAITPLGGVAFLVGWILLAVAALRG
jgi:uncharacterized membrane protein YgdD (TMEM256/DUF423 family)